MQFASDKLPRLVTWPLPTTQSFALPERKLLIPKAPLTASWRGFPRGEISDSFGAGDSRRAISGEIARRLFGERASHARSPVEGRQPRAVAFAGQKRFFKAIAVANEPAREGGAI